MFSNFSRALIVIVLFVLLPSCGDKSNENSTINLRLKTFTLNFNPSVNTDLESSIVGSFLYKPLIFKDSDGSIKKVLVEKYTQENGVWTFKLKNDIFFSDGSEITSSDVVSTFCRNLQPNSQWFWAFQSIKHVVVDDKSDCAGLAIINDKEFQIIEENPVEWFADTLSAPSGWILSSKYENDSAYGQQLSSGDYVISEIVPNVSVKLKSIKEESMIIFHYIVDDHIAVSKFKHKQLDILNLDSPFSVNQLYKSGSLIGDGYAVSTDLNRMHLAMLNKKRFIHNGWTERQYNILNQKLDSEISKINFEKYFPHITLKTDTLFQDVTYNDIKKIVPSQPEIETLPNTEILVISENDYFSNTVASLLPKNIGKVKLKNVALERSLYRKRLFDRSEHIYVDAFEAPIDSDIFWISFFRPHHPWSIVGNPLEPLSSLDIFDSKSISRSKNLIVTDNSWIPLFKSKQVFVLQDNINGLKFSGSGQVNYRNIKKEENKF